MPTKLTARQQDKLVEAAQNAIHFTVVGTGVFPLDMLRYDTAWPASEQNARLIANTFGNPNGQRRIELKGLKVPTERRWASFGWEVVANNG